MRSAVLTISTCAKLAALVIVVPGITVLEGTRRSTALPFPSHLSFQPDGRGTRRLESWVQSSAASGPAAKGWAQRASPRPAPPARPSALQ
jgi:hypothetical protein